MNENNNTIIRRSLEQPRIKFFRDYEETYKIVSGASLQDLSKQIFDVFVKDSTFTLTDNRNEATDSYLLSVVENVLSKKGEDRSLNVYLKYGSKLSEDGEMVGTDDVTNIAIVHGKNCAVLNTNGNNVSGFISSTDKLGIGENFEDLEYFMNDCSGNRELSSSIVAFDVSTEENGEASISQTHLNVVKDNRNVLYELNNVTCNYDSCGNLTETESLESGAKKVAYVEAEHGSNYFDQNQLEEFKRDFMPIKEIIVNQNTVQDLAVQQ